MSIIEPKPKLKRTSTKLSAKSLQKLKDMRAERKAYYATHTKEREYHIL